MTLAASGYPTKKLVLNLVKEAGEPVSAQMLIRMGELFGIDNNNVRVTLNRLSKTGFLSASERGMYELGMASEGLAAQQRAWRKLVSGLCDWNGGWLMIYVAHLGRRDRKSLRRRERAASMLGFAASHQGLLIRPDNLIAALGDIQDQLFNLGMDEEATLLKVADVARIQQFDIGGLWPISDIEEGYRQRIQTMQRWRRSVTDKSLEEAARESFLIGDEVLRSIAYDPRLPEEMIDTGLRRELVSEMAIFDDIGRQIWGDFMKRLETSPDK